ncbi:uncharacterized protein LOC127094579 [Lathyrus oleraceus]|uniref:uncharacterized protein LOC127094579 n=1 Tax=Pisum sativum TaxID=3888 RepID=UPI0021D2EFED|nr:uncharacterized protein LOC127094579 [Pisum sativum]
MASRVRPALSDNELVDIFMGTLHGLYFEKMIGSPSTNFTDMVTIGERVKSGLKSGKITDTVVSQSVNKRAYCGFTKKKEGEANVVMAKARPRHRRDNRPSTSNQRNPNQQYNRAQNRGNFFGNHPQFDKIPVPYSELVPYLVDVGAIIPKEFPVATPPFRNNHGPNASCAYHAGFIGHSTENCWALKCKIQDLINQNILAFSEEKPNVKIKPLLNHNSASVNVEIEEVKAEVVLKVEEVKTLMSVVVQKLEQFGFLEEVHEDCTVCECDPDSCEQLKGCVQALMDQGLIQFFKAQVEKEVAIIEPITIVYRKKKVEAPPKRIHLIHFRVPTPFPYQNTKAVPWNYKTTTYFGGKEICIPDTKIVNIAGAGGITRSGRVFAPKYTPRVSPAPTVVSPKEKATPTPTSQAKTTVPATLTVATTPVVTRVIDNYKAVGAEVSKGKGTMFEKEQSDDHKKSITFEESQEFLKNDQKK